MSTPNDHLHYCLDCNETWTGRVQSQGAPAWTATRELRIESGPVVISQVRTDPGDMGEPRVLESDGVTYVAVPDFDSQWSAPGLDVDLRPCSESECDCYAGHPAEELGFHYHHEPFWNEGTVERSKASSSPPSSNEVAE